jgi:hypothetical protein
VSPKAPKPPPSIDWTFIFDAKLSKCYGRVDDREAWRLACYTRATITEAAEEIGIKGVPRDAVPIRGVSALDARDRHIRYLERKKLEEAGLFIPYHKRRKLREQAEARAKARARAQAKKKKKSSPSRGKKTSSRSKAVSARKK